MLGAGNALLYWTSLRPGWAQGKVPCNSIPVQNLFILKSKKWIVEDSKQ
jgi:hypothetical protein